MPVYAVDFSNPTINPPAKIKNFASLLNVVIPIVMVIVGLIFLFMLISGAFMYLTSGGSPEKLKKAQSTLMMAIGGLFIVIFSYLIVKLLGYFFGVTIPI